jgi:uncharacterized protein
MNRLKNEKSPYLLQHANNPVDWYPWGEEAFEKAKKEDKPVFLSIGYATCHWCHVMEHESFEDEEVARRMNDAFVNIKVDREERPDIDNTYMTICQMLTGHGGWPLTIVMTPDKEPFFAATYLPRQSIPNRPGMMDLPAAIKNAWKNDREKVRQSVERIKDGFAKTLDLGKSSGDLPENIAKQVQDSLLGRFDASEGGFGSAPKFPSPHNLLFLIHHYRKNGNEKDLEMVNLTLKKMRLGGLWDHVGFGFHRYSTDRKWLLPHFEKMLYDQAMLLLAYAEGWTETKEPLFKQTARKIVEYIDDCLTSPDGAFYSAEDADSEGEEGKFYVWESDEIRNILSDEDAELFLAFYNFEEEGNFKDEATHQKTGKNIPHLKNPLPEESKKSGLKPDELASKIHDLLQKLKDEREKRIRPLLDDKILTDWNGLMITALARAGVVFNDPGYIEKAENAWKFIEEKCLNNDKILHRYKDGEAAINGMADDFAFTVGGLVELYNATFKPEYLKKAIDLQKQFEDEFWDNEHGGFYFTAQNAETLLGRQKEIYDGAIPSSNSVAAHNGFLLFKLTAIPEFQEFALSIFRAFSDQINHAPVGYTHAVHAFELFQTETAEVVITSKKMDEQVHEAVKLCRELLPAGSVILIKTDGWSRQLEEVAPFTKNYPVQDKFSGYVCENFECRMPVHSMEDLKNLLSH